MSTLLIRARRNSSAAEEIEPAGFYGSLQWMPPGESTISASVNGVPKRVKVIATMETAQLVDRRIKEMIQAADGGRASLPYIDFDHEDREAAAWPQSASWGGNDPLTGGVRLNVEWSEEGRAKVRGKSYQGFSPEFLLKDATVTGVGLNLGGLVNRPAFTGIQRVMAVQASIDGDFIGEIMTNKARGSFLVKAAELQAQHGLKNIEEASVILARENPDLYTAYQEEILARGGASDMPRAESLVADAVAGEFCVRAKRLAQVKGINEADAARQVAKADPSLYDEYRASLLGISLPVKVKARDASTEVEETEFVVRAKAIVEEEGIDLVEASRRLAADNPELYDDYIKTLGRS